jgi:hypothetical protein
VVLIKKRRTDHLTALIAAMGLCIGSASCGTPAMTYDEGKAFFAKNERALIQLNEKLEICGISSIAADGRKSVHEKCLTDRETAEEIESQLVDLGIESVVVRFRYRGATNLANSILFVLARDGVFGSGEVRSLVWTVLDMRGFDGVNESPRYQPIKLSQSGGWYFKTSGHSRPVKKQSYVAS